MGETQLNVGTVTEIPLLGGSDLCILHSQEITHRFRSMSVIIINTFYKILL